MNGNAKNIAGKLSEYFYLIDKKAKGKAVEQLRNWAEQKRKRFEVKYGVYVNQFKEV